LPGMLAHSLTPPYLIIGVKQDDADVRAKAFTVQHVAPQNFLRLDNPFSYQKFACAFKRGLQAPSLPKRQREPNLSAEGFISQLIL
jgi:hypothetical protein